MGCPDRAISAICLAAATFIATALAQTTVDPVSMAPQGSVTCYACGQTGVDPHADIAGSYCDVTIETNTCPAMSKIYNFTCDIMDKMDRSRLAHWERKCPDGVRSCFHAVGRYQGQEPVFRGCAGATYAHDEGCQRSMQTVSLNAGKSNVDIEINLCYCNGDKCNAEISSAPRAASLTWAALMTAGLVGIHAPSTQTGFLGIPFLALISSATASDAGSVSVAPIEVAEDGTVTCYACGQPDVNPKASFCDVTMSGHNCNLEATKIYNLSCSLMDNMQEPKLKKLWERQCPAGVKSCFYAEGGFPGEDTIRFRGCAGVQYADPFHECVLRKQPVPVDSLGQRSVDVDVTLCYCNEDLCNEVLNGAPRDSDSTTVLILVNLISAFATLSSR